MTAAMENDPPSNQPSNAPNGQPNKPPNDRPGKPPTGRPGASDNQAALDDLVALLDLEAIEVNLFRGRSPDENRQRVFGGQVAGQALVAAARTIDERSRLVHSLHAYFLRPGDPTVPILYEVDRIRDGRSFSTRRVVAIQHGRAIFNLQASFHDDEPGHDTQTARLTSLSDLRGVAWCDGTRAPKIECMGWLLRDHGCWSGGGCEWGEGTGTSSSDT